MRVLLVTVVILAAGCGGSTGPTTTTTAGTPSSSSTTVTTAASASTVSSASTSSTPGSTTSTSAAAATAAGCSSPAGIVPAGVVATPIPDVDGDGRTDRAYFDPSSTGVRKLVVLTAAGGRAEADVASASPIAASALVANAQGGTAQVLISDGREATLFVYARCALSVVHNIQGHPYTFDLGFGGHGTGVGCLTDASGSHLVGLNSTDLGSTTVHWTRTVIDVTGTSARNGATTSGTFTRPGDAVGISLLSTISCGSRTIDADGVHQSDG